MVLILFFLFSLILESLGIDTGDPILVFDPIFHVISRVELGVHTDHLETVQKAIYQCLSPDFLLNPTFGAVSAQIPLSHPEAVFTRIISHKRVTHMVLRYSTTRSVFYARCLHMIATESNADSFDIFDSDKTAPFPDDGKFTDTDRTFEVKRSVFAPSFSNKPIITIRYFKNVVFDVMKPMDLSSISESLESSDAIVYILDQINLPSLADEIKTNPCLLFQFSPADNKMRIHLLTQSLEQADFCLDNSRESKVHLGKIMRTTMRTWSFAIDTRILGERVLSDKVGNHFTLLFTIVTTVKPAVGYLLFICPLEIVS
eukprot:GDKJ01032148.1.p1 GENE.GDKJ01032148.1~~GDKJ01032148.1.p1  ORF type:complete len:315 (+),score=15.08 GDKJ01032148.1:28-972(+)